MQIIYIYIYIHTHVHLLVLKKSHLWVTTQFQLSCAPPSILNLMGSHVQLATGTSAYAGPHPEACSLIVNISQSTCTMC